ELAGWVERIGVARAWTAAALISALLKCLYRVVPEVDLGFQVRCGGGCVAEPRELRVKFNDSFAACRCSHFDLLSLRVFHELAALDEGDLTFQGFNLVVAQTPFGFVAAILPFRMK